MKLPFALLLAAALACGTARADKHLSPERLDAADQAGYISAPLKSAIRDYVAARTLLADTKAEQARLDAGTPALKKQADALETRVAALQQELEKYEHPEEIDFNTLRARIDDTTARPEEQLALAQAYVWTYPDSPHASEAQLDLERVQKKINDQQTATRNAEAARIAAHDALVRRAQARDLDLPGWRTLLRDMSQDDLIKLLGRPSLIATDDWTYSGDWTTDTLTGRKTGLEITFDAGRVINVDEKANAATP